METCFLIKSNYFAVNNGCLQSEETASISDIWRSKTDKINTITIAATSTSSFNEAINFLKSKKIIINDEEEIKRFFILNNKIMSHLYELPNKIKEYFGNRIVSTNIELSDKEIDYNTELFIEIETKIDPVEANSILTKLNKEWIIEKEDIDIMRINLILKFI